MEAATKGAGEIGFTIVSISLSLIAVFIPLFLMGGIVGVRVSETSMETRIVTDTVIPNSRNSRPTHCGHAWAATAAHEPANQPSRHPHRRSGPAAVSEPRKSGSHETRRWRIGADRGPGWDPIF
jgi:hypothetical protein